MCNYCDKVLLFFLFILNLVCNGVWLSKQFSIVSVVLVVALSAISAVVETFIASFLKSAPIRKLFVSTNKEVICLFRNHYP